MKHPDVVPGWHKTLDELAIGVGSMRYDRVAQFLASLSKEIKRQASGDFDRGRTRLSARLDVISHDLDAAKHGMNSAWKICKPHEERAIREEGLNSGKPISNDAISNTGGQ